MVEQDMHITAIQEASDGLLESIPELKDDTLLPKDDPHNLAAGVLRGVFAPIAVYLTEGAHNFSERGTHSPSALLGEVLKRTELEIPADLAEAVRAKYVTVEDSSQINWNHEAVGISLGGVEHPLSKLSQHVVGGLSPVARQATTALMS